MVSLSKGWRQRPIFVTINFHSTVLPDSIKYPFKWLAQFAPIQTQSTSKHMIPMTTCMEPRPTELSELYDVTRSRWYACGDVPATTTPWGVANTRRSESPDILHGDFMSCDGIKYNKFRYDMSSSRNVLLLYIWSESFDAQSYSSANVFHLCKLSRCQ